MRPSSPSAGSSTSSSASVLLVVVRLGGGDDDGSGSAARPALDVPLTAECAVPNWKAVFHGARGPFAHRARVY